MKKILALTLCACLFAGCSCAQDPAGTSQFQSAASAANTVSDSEFEDFTEEFVKYSCLENVMTARQLFADPAKYGIDLSECKVTLGSFLPDEEETAYEKKSLDQLKSWNPDDLSKTNHAIYDQLVWSLDLSVRSSEEKYDYFGDIWSSSNNVLSSLTTTFSEYQLDSESDIDILLKLIDDVPRFIDEAIDYTEKQAELGLFSIDLDAASSDCDLLLESKENSPIAAELDDEADGLGLDSSKTEETKKNIREALAKSFFPSIEKVKESLTSLKDENKPFEGLGRKKDGKEYFEMLVQNYSGSSDSIEMIEEELQTQTDSLLDEYNEILKENPAALSEMFELETGFHSIDEIMPFLVERYPAQFPLVSALDYEIKPLADEQSNDGITAYFVVQPFDSSRPYEIRYNKRDASDDPSSLELYDTFAHEGVPGHMYQAQYMADHFTNPIQFLVSCFGMQEGYASYAAQEAVQWLGLNEDAMHIYQINQLFSNFTILLMDIDINYYGLTPEQFEKKWGEGNEYIFERLCQDPGIFFGYYYGCYKLSALKEIAQEALADTFDPIRFNNAILEAGNVNFSIVEQNVQDYINRVRKGEGDNSSSDSDRPSTSGDPQKENSKTEGSFQEMTPAD